MIKSLFRISVSLGLIGIVLGIVMGIRQDFVLMPAHAHLNLLGFVTMFLSALYYRVVPEAAASGLARYQAIVSVAGAVVFPVGTHVVPAFAETIWGRDPSGVNAHEMMISDEY